MNFGGYSVHQKSKSSSFNIFFYQKLLTRSAGLLLFHVFYLLTYIYLLFSLLNINARTFCFPSSEWYCGCLLDLLGEFYLLIDFI